MRHNRLLKARRAAEPEKYRATDRKRQTRHRAKEGGLVGGPAGESLTVEIRQRIESFLDLALASDRPSRDLLTEALRHLACACVGQAEAGP